MIDVFAWDIDFYKDAPGRATASRSWSRSSTRATASSAMAACWPPSTTASRRAPSGRSVPGPGEKVGATTWRTARAPARPSWPRR
ncbi:MAG: hypothetical protein R3F43_01100 [bacterium]